MSTALILILNLAPLSAERRYEAMPGKNWVQTGCRKVDDRGDPIAALVHAFTGSPDVVEFRVTMTETNSGKSVEGKGSTVAGATHDAEKKIPS